jgi:hypothetical protein
MLGRKDSNLGMPGPKPGALPLGDAPTGKVEESFYSGMTTAVKFGRRQDSLYCKIATHVLDQKSGGSLLLLAFTLAAPSLE